MNLQGYGNLNSSKQENNKNNNSILNNLHEYFISNIISSSLALINTVGILYFLIYFVNIDYLPNLDFSGLIYLLIVMTLIGLFISIFLFFLFIVPGLAWKELSSFYPKNKKNNFRITPTFPAYSGLFLIVYIVSGITVVFISLYLKDPFYKLLTYFFSIFLFSFITSLFFTKLKSLNIKQFMNMSFLYFSISILIIFPIIGTYLISTDTKDIPYIMTVFFIIGLFTNLLIIKDNPLTFFISLLTFFCILFFFNPKLIPFLVIEKLHIGNFNATVVFKNEYCQTLKTYQIPISNENKISCSANIDKVLWRVGKESFFNVSDKNITVPSAQIISMTWPMIKPKIQPETNTSILPIISFEFNSTNLTKDGKTELLKQVKSLDKNTTKEITVYGCSSPEGTEKFNKILSIQRAKSVQSWVDGYLARGKNNIKVKMLAEGTSKHCTDEKLVKELENHRKVIIK